MPPGGVVLWVVADEEHGGDFGAKFLAEQRPETLGGVKHAFGEVGGISYEVAGQRFYPIQVAEKRMCHMLATVRGPGGHAARPMRGGAMARLGSMLRALDRKRTPVHVTPVARQMIESMAAALPGTQGHRPPASARSADVRLGAPADRRRRAARSRACSGTPSMRPSSAAERAVNVIPARSRSSSTDAFCPAPARRPARASWPPSSAPTSSSRCSVTTRGRTSADLAYFDELVGVLRELDPEGVPVPMQLPAVTDARHSVPARHPDVRLPAAEAAAELPGDTLAHAADERVPAEAVRFGAEAVFRALERYPG